VQILVEENVPRPTVEKLRELGHDVLDIVRRSWTQIRKWRHRLLRQIVWQLYCTRSATGCELDRTYATADDKARPLADFPVRVPVLQKGLVPRGARPMRLENSVGTLASTVRSCTATGGDIGKGIREHRIEP